MTEDDYEDDYWEIPDNLDTTTFDFEWRPSIYEPPFIHQFGTQWSRTGGPRLVVWGATQIKYNSDMTALAVANMSRWEVPPNLDTTTFDFSWHPEATDKPFIYQFGTQHQKTGGPRYVQGGARRIKYVDIQHAMALPDTTKWVVDPEVEVVDFDWSWHPDDTDPPQKYSFLNSILYDAGGTDIKPVTDIVPVVKYQPLDIIYLSNGESGEEARYQRLCELAGREVKWVRGINGREAALRYAAQISTTRWYILFPAKIWADDDFDFDFQPNKAIPQHFIFYAKNPLNGLEYGHQAAVCYNRQLVLETVDYGLDFTMSKPHDIVPVNCGIAQYNSNIIMTWRTAFREVIKLLAAGDPESMERLKVWRTIARGEFCEWSLIGAEDGVQYYNSVSGDHSELMRTFEWQWLAQFFKHHHGDIA